MSASVGVATSSGACDAEELLGRADAAMYRSKEVGPGTATLDETATGQVLRH